MAPDIVSNVRSKLRRTWLTAKYLTLSPREFFFDRMRPFGIRNELIFLFIIGLIGFIGWAFAARVILDPFVTGTEAALPGGRDATLPADVHYRIWGLAFWNSFGYILGAWIFYTIVIYAISWYFSERGDLFSIAKNIAWTLYPMLYGFLIMTIGLVASFWMVDEIDMDMPGRTELAVAHLYDHGLEDPIVNITMLAMIPFIIWTGYLAIFVVEKVRKLPRNTAVKIVIVPVLAHIVYVLWTVLSRLGWL